MYLGRIVESGDAKKSAARRSIRTPGAPFGVPQVDPDSKRQRIVLSGDVPSPIHPPGGCPFHPRCPVAEAAARRAPAWRELSPGRHAACHLPRKRGRMTNDE